MALSVALGEFAGFSVGVCKFCLIEAGGVGHFGFHHLEHLKHNHTAKRRWCHDTNFVAQIRATQGLAIFNFVVFQVLQGHERGFEALLYTRHERRALLSRPNGRRALVGNFLENLGIVRIDDEGADRFDLLVGVEVQAQQLGVCLC